MFAVNLPLTYLANCDELLEMLETIHKAKKKIYSHYTVQSEDLDKLRNKRNESLLFVAAKTANLNILEILIEADADVNVQNSLGQTPLMLTLIIADISKFRPVIEILCASNANIHQIDKLGNSPVQFVVNRDCYSHYAAYNFVHELFLNIVHRECMNDAETTAKKLIDLKYSLWRAVDLGNAEVIQHMIAQGCPIDSCHRYEHFTALHRAVGSMDLEIVKVLIEQGASLDSFDSKNRLPIDYYDFDKIQQSEIIEILLDEMLTQLGHLYQTHTPYYVRKAFKCGTRKIVRMMLERVGLNEPIGPDGMFPLHYLLQNCHSGVIEELRGREINVNARDKLGRSPLWFSPYRVDTLRFLLENGADPNTRGQIFQLTMSELYANKMLPRERHREIVEIILHHGLVFDFDGGGHKILNIIADRGMFYMSETLIKHLAMLDEMKKPIKERILNDINSHAEYKRYFDVCKAELAEMKDNVVSKKLTLYTIITKQMSDEKILKNCSPSLLSKFEKLKGELQPNNYYHTVIQKRITKIIAKLELIQKASTILCKLLKLGNNPYHIIVTEILSYLNNEDHQTLVELDI